MSAATSAVMFAVTPAAMLAAAHAAVTAAWPLSGAPAAASLADEFVLRVARAWRRLRGLMLAGPAR
jgi:hypothetical protein